MYVATEPWGIIVRNHSVPMAFIKTTEIIHPMIIRIVHARNHAWFFGLPSFSNVSFTLSSLFRQALNLWKRHVADLRRNFRYFQDFTYQAESVRADNWETNSLSCISNHVQLYVSYLVIINVKQCKRQRANHRNENDRREISSRRFDDYFRFHNEINVQRPR